MNSDFRKVSFSTHAHIKNIIGKELINDDNVAVMELVKNSYDAGATRVNIEFKNLVSDKNKLSELIISDDGVGMSENDVLTKWLNIAYSSKKNNHTQNNRYQAGNKGVGRFSCDRLGKKLNIYTKQKDGKVIHLKISWKDFEDANKIDIQIQDIPVLIREIEKSQFKEESGFDTFEQGTILQIIDLNEEWIEFDRKDNLFNDIDIDKTKLLRLKNSLERLINPNQSFDEHSFKIFIYSNNELNEDKLTPYHERVLGEIKNQIFSKLDFKTTFIESLITKDGTKIITELKDKNETIFRLIEKNIEFSLLKDIKITIYYLNPYAKGFFKKQTSIDSVEFGSVFLFINGFRIPPYGDRENDALGLEVRKGQGTARYFGNREILGRIEIKDFQNNFRVISSREGIVQNNYYKQLIRDSEKKNRKYNSYFYNTLKRLEKYVVDGLKWDSIPEDMKEATIQKKIVDGDWDESDEVYKIEKKETLLNTSEIIKQMLYLNPKNLIDLYINEELIENLIEEDKEKTNKKLQDFIKNFGGLSADILDEKTQKAIKSMAKNIDDKSLSESFKNILTQKQVIEQELEDTKKSKEELYKIFRKKVREDRKKAKVKAEKLEKELAEIKKEKTFFQRLNTSDKQQVLDLHHSIGTATVTINNHLGRIQKKIKSGESIDKNYLEKTINQISFVNNKIASIANFATKASWDADSEDIKDNIVKYIEEYIQNVCMIELKTLDHQDLLIKLVNNVKDSFVLTFQPIKIAMLFDNLISNSRKAYASQINITLSIKDEKLEIEYIDNGRGISSEIMDKIFNLGFSTTSGGAGMGMSHIEKILKELNDSSIIFDSTFNNGAKFIIRIKL